MSTEIQFQVDVATTVIFCARCECRVQVHRVWPVLAMIRAGYAHVECHGMHRIVEIPEYARRVQELVSRDRDGRPVFVALWEQLGDAMAAGDPIVWQRDVREEIELCRSLKVEPDIAEDLANHIANLEALSTSIAVLVQQRLGRGDAR